MLKCLFSFLYIPKIKRWILRPLQSRVKDGWAPSRFTGLHRIPHARTRLKDSWAPGRFTGLHRTPHAVKCLKDSWAPGRFTGPHRTPHSRKRQTDMLKSGQQHNLEVAGFTCKTCLRKLATLNQRSIMDCLCRPPLNHCSIMACLLH